MDVVFYTIIWNNVAVVINAATTQMITALMGWARDNFPMCATAYLVIMYMIAAWSSDPSAWQRFFRHVFLAATIWSLSTVAAAFDYYVLGLVNGFINTVTAAIGGIFGQGGGPITAQTFDHITMKVFAYGAVVFNHVGTFDPKSWVLALIIPLYWIFSLLGIFIIFVVFLAGSIVTNFVVSFGPLFIPLYFFTFTRRFFDGWVSVVVGGILTQIFTVGWLAMFVSSLGAMLNQVQTAAGGTANGAIEDIATQIIVLILAWLLIDIFSAMTSISVYVAIRISGGVNSTLGSFPSAWTFNQPQMTSVGNTQAPGSAGHGGGGLFGPSPGTAPAPNGAPALANGNYAFNRNVGSAP